MAWNPFFIKQSPQIGGGGSATITDSTFPFDNNTIYRNLTVWITTTAGASYTANIMINGVVQDSQSVDNTKFVSQYELQSLIVKDPSYKFQVVIINATPNPVSFIVMIAGEYYT